MSAAARRDRRSSARWRRRWRRTKRRRRRLEEGSAFGREAKTSSFDKLRMRFSTVTTCTVVLILSLSKDEDHAPGVNVDGPRDLSSSLARPALLIPSHEP